MGTLHTLANSSQTCGYGYSWTSNETPNEIIYRNSIRVSNLEVRKGTGSGLFHVVVLPTY